VVVPLLADLVQQRGYIAEQLGYLGIPRQRRSGDAMLVRGLPKGVQLLNRESHLVSSVVPVAIAIVGVVF
jgi:hypothetical protein